MVHARMGVLGRRRRRSPMRRIGERLPSPAAPLSEAGKIHRSQAEILGVSSTPGIGQATCCGLRSANPSQSDV